MRRIAAHLSLIAALTACGDAPRTASADTAVTVAAPPGQVDSILPIAEELRRFQAGVAAPAGLSGGASSRDALVRRFVDRLAARDTAALRTMVLTRAEFAHLVYPASSYTKPPYRTPPGLVWMQLAEGSAKGLSRLLRPEVEVRGYVGHECAASQPDGGVTLWRGCRASVSIANGDTVRARLFGVIVEHAGQYKFASYETDF